MSEPTVPHVGVLAGVRFLSELVMLAAMAYIGSAMFDSLVLRIIAGFALPLAAAALWGTFVAPRAPRHLGNPARTIVEVLIFGFAVVGLLVFGQPWLAALLAVLYVVGLMYHHRAG